MPHLSLRVALFVTASAVLAVAAALHAQIPRSAEPLLPLPDTVTPSADPRVVALGARLFADVRLSGARDRSCTTCHPLDRGGMDGRRLASLPDARTLLRNTPTIFNVGFNASYNWDGAFDTLEAHAERTLPTVMAIAWPELLARVQRDAEYVATFRLAFDDRRVTQPNVIRALTAFERSLVTPRSRFDRYLRGERSALTARERQGYELFTRRGCVSCHQGTNIGGNMVQRFGVFQQMTPEKRQGGTTVIDRGRVLVTGVPRDEYVFRVPSLRNVAITAPYFHDGREPSLDAAVDTMAKAQLGRRLSAEEIDCLVAFLRTLTGEYQGRLLAAAPDGTSP